MARSPPSTFVAGVELISVGKAVLVETLPMRPICLVGDHLHRGFYAVDHSAWRKIAPRFVRAYVLSGCVLFGLLFFSIADSSAAPQTDELVNRLSNIEACNGSDRSSPDAQLKGCSALINTGKETKLFLAIAHNNRGNAYLTKGDYNRAIEDYSLAINYNPEYAKPFNNRGVAFQKKGDFDRAIADFNQAIKLKPDYATAFANRGETNQKKREYQSAAKDYAEAIRLNPDLEGVWNGRCWSRAVIGELRDALADCNKALLLQPNNAAYHDSRGLTYLKMGQFDAAIEDYSAALRIDSNLASALYGRGLAKLKKGDANGGNADLAAARKLTASIVDDFSRYDVK